MKTWKNLVVAVGGVVVMQLGGSSVAQQPLITSFQGNGQLTWTNLPGTNGFTVQWAPTLAGPWASDWHALDSIISTGAHTTVSVPMFYRVAQGFSLSSMRGLWIGASPTNGNVYFRGEDDGLLSEVGIFNLRTPNGYFTVTPSGWVTVTFLAREGPFSFTGQIGQPTNGFGTLYRVETEGRCAGTWSGNLTQTTGPGSPAVYPVSFDVDYLGLDSQLFGFSRRGHRSVVRNNKRPQRGVHHDGRFRAL